LRGFHRLSDSKDPEGELFLKIEGAGPTSHAPRAVARWIVLGLTNTGTGIAKFPSIRYKRSSGLTNSNHGIDGSFGFGLPLRGSESEWVVFRGGVDDVIYPGETRKITKLWQSGTDQGPEGLPLPKQVGTSGQPLTTLIFRAADFECEIPCEGIASTQVKAPLPEEKVTL
jgi:hypothetical protein